MLHIQGLRYFGRSLEHATNQTFWQIFQELVNEHPSDVCNFEMSPTHLTDVKKQHHTSRT